MESPGREVNMILNLAQAVGDPVGCHFGSQLAMTLVAVKNDIIFFLLARACGVPAVVVQA